MTSSLVHALGGSFGGAASMVLTYPLEQVRTLVQTGELELSLIPVKYTNFGSTLGRILFIICEDPQGWARLYQGCASVVETVAVSNFCYFYITQYTRQFLRPMLRSPASLTLLSSTVGGVLNILLTEPLWKANTILKTQKTDTKNAGNNLISVIIFLVKKDGIKSLWKGTLVSLWLVSNPIIQFTLYEYFKRIFKLRVTPPLHAFLFGAMAKAGATIATYPLQVAQTRLRMSDANVGIVGCLSSLYATKGFEGIFHGWSAKLSQTVLTAAFMFAFYERIVAILQAKKR